jgi:transposase-like protein
MALSSGSRRGPTKNTFAEEKRQRALEVIVECGGNLTLASCRLGISIPTLSRWRRAALLEHTGEGIPSRT